MKKQKPVLMFAKVSTEKVSSTGDQRIEKEQKQNAEFAKLIAEK